MRDYEDFGEFQDYCDGKFFDWLKEKRRLNQMVNLHEAEKFRADPSRYEEPPRADYFYDYLLQQVRHYRNESAMFERMYNLQTKYNGEKQSEINDLTRQLELATAINGNGNV